METFPKKKIWNISYYFSSANTNADGSGARLWIKSSTPIFGIIMFGLGHSFFSWIDI
jgi:hypothetical protein